MTILLGIDPGSIRTGYGLIHANKQTVIHIAHGTIRAKGDSVAARLHYIYTALCDIILTHKPERVAIEEVFMQINVQSALKLGQARGAALMASAKYALPLHEYSARTIKKTATGYGAASKEQVQLMIQKQLALSMAPEADAADALAIAICDACCSSNILTQS